LNAAVVTAAVVVVPVRVAGVAAAGPVPNVYVTATLAGEVRDKVVVA
jgi:hypothetical protein